MNIIRYNSLRWVNPFAQPLLSFVKDAYSVKNNSELRNYLRNKKLILSKYNIVRFFDDNRTVIYNTLYDSIVMLEEKETAQFKVFETLTCDSSLICILYRLGILITDIEDEALVMKIQNEELIYNRKGVPSITILPTQVCNARCQYCFASHNTGGTMTMETVEQLINFLAEHFHEGDSVLFRWFGGEPLLAPKIIDGIIDGVSDAFHGKLQYSSLMFTNGSMLNDDLIAHAKDKWHMEKIQLTIDGYAIEHNRRKSYFDQSFDYYHKIIQDIEKLLNVGIKVDCRVNLDKDNIKQLDDICRDLLPYRLYPGFRARFTILRPTDCGFSRFNFIKSDDLEWAYSIIYSKLMEYGFIKHIVDLIPKRQQESCIAKSINKMIIGSDGKLYKCLQQVFDEESTIGDLRNGIDLKRCMSYCRLELHEECKECVYLPLCSGGCSVYWNLSKREAVSPCIREKYFIDMLMKALHRNNINGSCDI